MNKPFGARIAHNDQEEFAMHRDKSLYLAGFVDCNDSYMTKEDFDKRCSELERYLGHPDVAFENTAKPVFLPAMRVNGVLV